MSDHLRTLKFQKCDKKEFLDVSFLLTVHKARLFHNLIADWKFTCLQTYIVTGSITGQISSREHELHTQGILRVVVTGNIERLPTGSQEGYLWLGLSSFINTLTSIILYYSQSIYLCPPLLQIVSTNTSLYCHHTVPSTCSHERQLTQTQPVLA